MGETKTITRGSPEEQAIFDQQVALTQARQEIAQLREALGIQVTTDPAGGPSQIAPVGLALGGAVAGFIGAKFLSLRNPALYALGAGAAGYAYGTWRDRV